MKDLQPLRQKNCKIPKCHYTVPKCQIGTLEVLAVLDLIKNNSSVKQTELSEQTGKSVRSIKRIIDSLKEKQYIRRVDGKRYGKWEVLV
ncbi:MAG: winged helix-turn-helix domain-containing protein [Angelakisella sp.]|nr:winged helix-turn-helix domain-containing protein [Angelakisella sp.]